MHTGLSFIIENRWSHSVVTEGKYNNTVKEREMERVMRAKGSYDLVK
jgi:hypothetical protein